MLCARLLDLISTGPSEMATMFELEVCTLLSKMDRESRSEAKLLWEGQHPAPRVAEAGKPRIPAVWCLPAAATDVGGRPAGDVPSPAAQKGRCRLCLLFFSWGSAGTYCLPMCRSFRATAIVHKFGETLICILNMHVYARVSASIRLRERHSN